MGIKEQLQKLKENWLLVMILAVGIILLMVFLQGKPLLQAFPVSEQFQFPAGSESIYKSGIAGIADNRGIMPESGFAPGAEQRKITKTASLSSEVEHGQFFAAEEKVKSIIDSTDSYLLQQNVDKFETGRKSYYSGNYQIKADSRKYSTILAQLKEIGEIKYFNENALDITGQYTDIKIEFEAEKARLGRYKAMLEQASAISEKIELSDRIFNQERTIKYLEDSLRNIDQQVVYSSIYFQLTEKRSPYADVAFVKFSELVRNIVSSVNTLINLFVLVLPYALAGGLLWVGIRWARQRRK